jgi:hypothetical protein
VAELEALTQEQLDHLSRLQWLMDRDDPELGNSLRAALQRLELLEKAVKSLRQRILEKDVEDRTVIHRFQHQRNVAEMALKDVRKRHICAAPMTSSAGDTGAVCDVCLVIEQALNRG